MESGLLNEEIGLRKIDREVQFSPVPSGPKSIAVVRCGI